MLIDGNHSNSYPFYHIAMETSGLRLLRVDSLAFLMDLSQHVKIVTCNAALCIPDDEACRAVQVGSAISVQAYLGY